MTKSENLKKQHSLISDILKLENELTSYLINQRGNYKPGTGDKFQNHRDKLKQLRSELDGLKRNFESLKN